MQGLAELQLPRTQSSIHQGISNFSLLHHFFAISQTKSFYLVHIAHHHPRVAGVAEY